MKLTDLSLTDWFWYHPPVLPSRIEKHKKINDLTKVAARGSIEAYVDLQTFVLSLVEQVESKELTLRICGLFAMVDHSMFTGCPIRDINTLLILQSIRMYGNFCVVVQCKEEEDNYKKLLEEDNSIQITTKDAVGNDVIFAEQYRAEWVEPEPGPMTWDIKDPRLRPLRMVDDRTDFEELG